MTENMKKLLELASKNPDLQDKLANATKESLIVLAKEAGVSLTEADFESPADEISDEELETVSGGKRCYCIVGGGGTGEASNGTKTCACVISGAGYMKKSNSNMRCICASGGIGENFELNNDYWKS